MQLVLASWLSSTRSRMMLPSTTRWSVLCCVMCRKIFFFDSSMPQCSARLSRVWWQISSIATRPSDSLMYPVISFTVASLEHPSVHSAHRSSQISASSIASRARSLK